MKKYLEILRVFSIVSLLFILASTVGVSESTYKVSVNIVQSSTDQDSDKACTVVNAYNKDGDTPGVHIVGQISGSNKLLMTNDGDTTYTGEDIIPDENADLGVIDISDLILSELTPDEFSAGISEWIGATMDKNLILSIDLPGDSTNIISAA